MKGKHSILHVIENANPSSMTITEIAEKRIHDQEIVDAISCLQDESWNGFIQQSVFVQTWTLTYWIYYDARNPHSYPIGVKTGDSNVGTQRPSRRVSYEATITVQGVVKFVKSCRDCIMVSQALSPTAMKRTTFPEGPWIFVATDLLGPLPNNEHILVFIDYYSRCMEYKFLKSISSMSLIKQKHISTR